MNYERIYFAFIEKWKAQEIDEGVYTEKHHIIPVHAGGGNDRSNLVELTFRQHTFAHRLLWKAYGRWEDKFAYLMMRGTSEEARSFLGREQGRRNVESGQLDQIRPLANTPEQRRKAGLLIRSRIESGEHYENIRKGHEAWRGKHHTEEWKKQRSKLYKERYKTPEAMDHIRKISKLSAEKKAKDSARRSEDVINNAKRDEKYLHMTSPTSKYKFISPEGLIFDGVTFAALYYGVKPYLLDNWCKRGQHGWKRIPKQQEINDLL